MTTVEDFVALVRDQLGLDVTTDDLTVGFDELPGWDSVQLLMLCSALEHEIGRSISLAEVLDAPNLDNVYKLVTG